jgi:hypothetical protein
MLNGAFVVNYLGFAPWLYPEMEFGWKMTWITGFTILQL